MGKNTVNDVKREEKGNVNSGKRKEELVIKVEMRKKT